MTRRQLLSAVMTLVASAAASATVAQQNPKKPNEPKLQTITLSVTGMT